MLISIILDVCIVSHLEGCRYVSFCELIVSCSTFEKIDSLRVSFLLVIMLDEDPESKDVKIKMTQ